MPMHRSISLTLNPHPNLNPTLTSNSEPSKVCFMHSLTVGCIPCSMVWLFQPVKLGVFWNSLYWVWEKTNCSKTTLDNEGRPFVWDNSQTEGNGVCDNDVCVWTNLCKQLVLPQFQTSCPLTRGLAAGGFVISQMFQKCSPRSVWQVDARCMSDAEAVAVWKCLYVVVLPFMFFHLTDWMTCAMLEWVTHSGSHSYEQPTTGITVGDMKLQTLKI